jgi:CheY-like chemotaxis protein
LLDLGQPAIVGMSNAISPETSQLCLEMGMQKLMRKPAEKNELMLILKQNKFI